MIQEVVTFSVVFETTAKNRAPTRNFCVQQVTNSLERVNNATIGVAAWQENGRRLRATVFGEPTEVGQQLMDAEFGGQDEVITA